MSAYDKSQLQKMIEDYNKKMMLQYGDQIQKPSNSETLVTQPSEDSSEISIKPTLTHSEFTQESEPLLTDSGELQIRVSTENQAVPIENAAVTVTHITDGERVLDASLFTDKSGLTPIISLPTVDRSLSLQPGVSRPYAVYTVDVAASGYFPKSFIDLPIYGGVTAIQSVSMIPLPEVGGDDIVLSYPQSGPSL